MARAGTSAGVRGSGPGQQPKGKPPVWFSKKEVHVAHRIEAGTGQVFTRRVGESESGFRMPESPMEMVKSRNKALGSAYTTYE